MRSDLRQLTAITITDLTADADFVILMDAEGDPSPARNYDGTPVIIEGEWVHVKELWCPGDSCGCGGCTDSWEDYKIGDGRFFWQRKDAS